MQQQQASIEERLAKYEARASQALALVGKVQPQQVQQVQPQQNLVLERTGCHFKTGLME